jgi:thiamine-phosphate pyrophosphorylase
MLREAAALASPLPLVAIGGIDAANAASAIAAGAAAIAVISAVAGAADPERATRELARAVAEARRG